MTANPPWAGYLPLVLIVSAFASFVSWGREYVVTGFLLLGFAAFAVLLGPILPSAMVFLIRLTTQHLRKSTDENQLVRPRAFLLWLIRSLLWCGTGVAFLIVLLTGPTARAVTIGFLVVWALWKRHARWWAIILGVLAVAIFVQAAFSDPANSSSMADVLGWVIVVCALGSIFVEPHRSYLEMVMRIGLGLGLALAWAVVLLAGPPLWSVATVLTTGLILHFVKIQKRTVVVTVAASSVIAVLSHLAANPVEFANNNYPKSWLAICLVIFGFIIALRWVGRWPREPQFVMRRFATVGIVLSFFSLAKDWDRRPVFDEKTPDVNCRAILNTDGALPNGGAGESRHKIYDIKLTADGRTLVFCDKLGHRIGRIDLESGQVTLSDRLEMMPERLIVEDATGSVTAFMRESVLFRPGLMAEFDLASLKVRKTCPMGRWVDFVPALEAGHFVAIQELVGEMYEMDMSTCRIREIEIDTALPYDLVASDQGQRYFVSGWFYSSTLSRAERYPRGELGETRSHWIGPFSLGMAVNDATRSLFVARPTTWAIDVVDSDTLRRRTRIPALPWVRAIAAAPERDAVITANFFSGQIAAFRASTGDLIATGQGPDKEARTMLWDSPRQRLFVTGRTQIMRCELGDLATSTAKGAEVR